ncbi:hypothetical protein K0U91_00865 [Chryseobacterium chendengshani]|uniref:hypothetical protein n=1 Tax=Chryseobacterium sp. LJ668 TaxID=2864040 RepID=UPI001C6907C7|nr:hypothetical protein [Chryseobacterium sp. LJ668]MBW8523774.1 hypothetical protein [Chryseobacterium sp. LJ668]QYK16718.1 hypothetical protein K0U91_00865 [Chryseobacterium sp. LJ668]
METNLKNENFTISGDWTSQSKKLKEKYSLLKDSDLQFDSGQDNALIARIENKLSKNRAEVIEMITRNVIS